MDNMDFGSPPDMATIPAASQPEMPTTPENFDNGPIITADPNAPAPPDPEKKEEEPKKKEFDWRAVLKSSTGSGYTGAMPASATEDLYGLNAGSRQSGDALRASLEKQYGSYGSFFYNTLKGMGQG